MAASEKRVCPDCGGAMVEGFMLQPVPAGYAISRWLKGRPRRSWWRGIKTKNVECRAVETYRCIRCGLLKSYARREIKAGDVIPKGDD